MRILHIIDDLDMGGAQCLLVELSKAQISLSNDVSVLAFKKISNQTIVNQLETNGVTVIMLTGRNPYNPINVFRIIPYLNYYDVIHAHLFPALYWVGIAKILCFGRVPPVFYTEHSTKNRRRSNPFLRRVDNFIYKKGYDEIIACSDKALETFRNIYPSVKHIIAINNGVDIYKYKNATPYSKEELWGIDKNTFVFTMVARFAYMKRQDTLVDALSKLPPNYHVAFVGGEPNDDGLVKVEKHAKELNVSDRVHFMYMRTDIPRILKSSDAVVMSSEYEGLSLSSVEGMSSGKPFIATNVTGLIEVVKGAGILFELGNSDELAGILMHLSTDERYREEVVDKCIERAQNFDISKMVDLYMLEYRKFLQ